MQNKHKLLYILNMARRINDFSYTSMIAAQQLGMEFHIAGNWSYESDEERLADERKYGVKIHQIDFIRAPYHPGNKKAYLQLKELVKKEKYDSIHCNTPIGGLLGRIVGKQCKVDNVIYQVHGFHFYKGAPKKNWLLYYPIEKLLARYTDALITINKEDYEFAKRKIRFRKSDKIFYVPGVGIDVEKYSSEERKFEEKRDELNIPRDAFVLISVGELNANKNNSVIISAMGQLKHLNIHYVLCGVGDKESDLRKQAEDAGLKGNVHFLGYRNDVKELYKMSDCFVMPSFREGLSRSIMEAMSSGLPCVVSKIRGNVDLIQEEKGGYLCSPTDVDAFANAIRIIAENTETRKNMEEYNLDRIQQFGVPVVIKEMERVYSEVLF